MRTLTVLLCIGLAAICAYWINRAIEPYPEEMPYGCGTGGLRMSFDPRHERGRQLFFSNCARCHSPSLERDMTGPALYRVNDRVPSREWVYQWVRNSQALVKSGDRYAMQIFTQNNEEKMDAFPNLSEADIDSIMVFIESYGH